MQTSERRQTYFAQLQKEQKDTNYVEYSAELGCCDRLMRGLSNIKEMVELTEDIPSGPLSREQLKQRMEAEIKRRQAQNDVSMYCPGNTQY